MLIVIGGVAGGLCLLYLFYKALFPPQADKDAGKNFKGGANAGAGKTFDWGRAATMGFGRTGYVEVIFRLPTFFRAFL